MLHLPGQRDVVAGFYITYTSLATVYGIANILYLKQTDRTKDGNTVKLKYQH
jgi:hypothetical protein